MDYLAFKLVWWLLGALVFGFIVGWLSCSRPRAMRPDESAGAGEMAGRTPGV